MLKALPNMSETETRDAGVQEDSCLLLYRDMVTWVFQAKIAEMLDKKNKDMQVHPKLAVYAIRMTSHQLVNPVLARQLRGVVGLLPVVWRHIEHNNGDESVHNCSRGCSYQLPGHLICGLVTHGGKGGVEYAAQRDAVKAAQSCDLNLRNCLCKFQRLRPRAQ